MWLKYQEQRALFSFKDRHQKFCKNYTCIHVQQLGPCFVGYELVKNTWSIHVNSSKFMAVLQFHPFGTNFTLLCLQPWALFIVSFSLWCSWPSIFPIIYSFFTFSCSTLYIYIYIYIYIMIMGMVMHVRFPMNFIYRGLTFYTMKIKITTFYSHVSLAFMSMIDTNDGIHEIR